MTATTAPRATRVRNFRAPLDGARTGRLVFDSGTPDLAISADMSPDDLLSARFTRLLPDVRLAGGEVVVTYPNAIPVLSWIRYAVQSPRARVALNPSIPWELEFRHGVTQLDADLREVDVRSVAIQSGISHAVLRLGRPSGTVRINMASGVGHLDLRRPAGTPVRFAVDGAIGSLTIDGNTLGAVGGRLRRESPGWHDAANRVDVVLVGGVGHLEVSDRDGG
jgi:hypothetical protein